MFLILIDDGDILSLADYTIDDLKAVDNGYARLIDITDPKNPTEYIGEGNWTFVDRCK